jgi:hypothetical protein
MDSWIFRPVVWMLPNPFHTVALRLRRSRERQNAKLELVAGNYTILSAAGRASSCTDRTETIRWSTVSTENLMRFSTRSIA